MAAKTIGQEETGHGSNRTKNAMMIGRHLIQSRPCALGIDRQILKGRYPVGSVHQNLLNKRRLEVRLVARRFFRIVPRQQKATAFWPEMEARAHVDDHG